MSVPATHEPYLAAGSSRDVCRNNGQAEDFWALNEATVFVTPSRIVGSVRGKHQLFLFEEGLEPQWETPALRDGGRWIVSLEMDAVRI